MQQIGDIQNIKIICKPFPTIFFDTTLTTSVAIALGLFLSRDVAATGNWYST